MTFGLGILEPIMQQRNYAPGLGKARETDDGSTDKKHLGSPAMPKDMTVNDQIVMMWLATVDTSGDEPGFKVEIGDEAGNAHSTPWTYVRTDVGGSNLHFAHRVADCTRYTDTKMVTADLKSYCTGSGSGDSATDGTLSKVEIRNAVGSEGSSHIYCFTMFLRRG